MPILIGSGGTADRSGGRTVAVVSQDDTGLPRLLWTGPDVPGLDARGVAAARDHSGGSRPSDGDDPCSVALLPEVARLWFGRGRLM